MFKSVDLLSIARYGGAVWSLNQLVKARNEDNKAYIGYSAAGRAVDGANFTQFDIGAFLSGNYKGIDTNPHLRFSFDVDTARRNYFRLDILNKGLEARVNEVESLYDWANRRPVNYLNTVFDGDSSILLEKNEKNFRLFGRNGVAWVTADAVKGKTWDWRGNNDIDLRQAKDSQDGNQLNIWMDFAGKDIANNVALLYEADNISPHVNITKVDSSDLPTLVKLRKNGDARTISPVGTTPGQSTSFTFEFLEPVAASANPLSFQISYEVSQEHATSLTSSVKNIATQSGKHTIAVGLSWSPNENAGGFFLPSFGAELNYAYETGWSDTQEFTTEDKTTTTKKVTQKYDTTFNPLQYAESKEKEGKSVTFLGQLWNDFVTQIFGLPKVNSEEAQGAKPAIELKYGRTYKVSLELTEQNVTSEFRGFIDLKGDWGNLPLFTSLFGTNRIPGDKLTNLAKQPSFSSPSAAEFIRYALKEGALGKTVNIGEWEDPETKNRYKDIEVIQKNGLDYVRVNQNWVTQSRLHYDIGLKWQEVVNRSSPLVQASLPSSFVNYSVSSVVASPLPEARYQESAQKSLYAYYLKLNALSDKPGYDLAYSTLKSMIVNGSEAFKELEISNDYIRNILFEDDLESDSVPAPTGNGPYTDDLQLRQADILLELSGGADDLVSTGSARLVTIDAGAGNDLIIAAEGDVVNAGAGNDIIAIHDPRQDSSGINSASNEPIITIVNLSAGNDVVVTNGHRAVVTGDLEGDGDLTVLAKGRLTQINGNGHNRMFACDLEGTKFINGFNPLKDSIFLDQEVYNKHKQDLHVVADQYFSTVDIYIKDHLSVSIGFDPEYGFAVDAEGQIDKADSLMYLIGVLNARVLSQISALQILDAYLDKAMSGNDFFLLCLQSNLALAPTNEDGYSFENAKNLFPRLTSDLSAISFNNLTIGELSDINFFREAIQPFIKAFDADAESFADMDPLIRADLVDQYNTIVDEAALGTVISDAFDDPVWASQLILSRLFDYALPLTNVSAKGSLIVDLFSSPGPDRIKLEQPSLISVIGTSSDSTRATLNLQNVDTGEQLRLFDGVTSSARTIARADRITQNSGELSWKNTENQSLGNLQSSLVSSGVWRPIYSDSAGQVLQAQSLDITGNNAVVSFANGVSFSMFLGGSSTLDSAFPGESPLVSVRRLADNDNALAFYETDPITGHISVDGKLVSPGDQDYLPSAFALALKHGAVLYANDLPSYEGTRIYRDLPLSSQKNYGLLLLPNGSSDEIVSSFSSANPGGALAMIGLTSSLNGITYGIEDLPFAISDRDYNDLIVSISSPSVPLG